MGPKPKLLAERFWAKVDKRDPDECWDWRGTILKSGYGNLHVGRDEERRTIVETAHRVSFELHHRALQPGELVCHKCDRRSCVNPAHLFAGSFGDNARDAVAKDRHARGERHPRAKLTDAAVRDLRAGRLSVAEASSDFDVSARTVRKAVSGEKWTHI